MQVLLVEDDPDLAELVIEYLEDEAIECDLAYHGDMALQLIAQHSYDVIVTDIMLPGISGLTLCQQMRQQGAHHQQIQAAGILCMTSQQEHWILM